MKRLFIYTAMVLALGIAFSSCYKDIIKPELAEDPDGPPKQVSYKTELAPFLVQVVPNRACNRCTNLTEIANLSAN
jgi:hypothetical protein